MIDKMATRVRQYHADLNKVRGTSEDGRENSCTQLTSANAFNIVTIWTALIAATEPETPKSTRGRPIGAGGAATDSTTPELEETGDGT
jgi:hypothetical protein